MKAVKKLASMRHFVALSLLAVVLSIFSAGAGKAAVQSKGKPGGDPVIGSMSWEVPPGSGGVTLLDDNLGCPINCVNHNCPVNANCPSNCPDEGDCWNCPGNVNCLDGNCPDAG
jgi:hypothetical protein